MDTQKHQKMREKVEEKQSDQAKEVANQPPLTAATSPPSSSSSPSHEFSFTISLHPTTTTTTTAPAGKAKTAPSPPSIAIDLSPADDIFFHGHLLPLHFLSHPHLPVSSARSSTNSQDSFTLPIRELLEDHQHQNPNKTTTNNNNNSNYNNYHHHHHHQTNNNGETKERTKSKSFSLFGRSKWRKGCEVIGTEDHKEKPKKKNMKMRFDVSHVLKRYMRMVRPLLSFRGGRRERMQLSPRHPYSFSGNLSSLSSGKQQQEWSRGRIGEFSSAPASMRTSPTNSGLLIATHETINTNTSTSNSTMEELQAAIQSAIAHCKNSISVEEKVKC